jgi:hypothetical protein
MSPITPVRTTDDGERLAQKHLEKNPNDYYSHLGKAFIDEEWSDEESAFDVFWFRNTMPIRHENGRKADPSLSLRMTWVRFSGLRHSLKRARV